MNESTAERLERRLLAWGLDRLSAAEADEVERAWMELQRQEGSGEAGQGHIPARMLVHWQRVERELSGLERELAERHLARCASCRADLAQLRSWPTRTADPHRLRPWFGGAAIGAALAAGLLWMLVPPRPSGQTNSGLVEGPLPWVAPSFVRGVALSESAILPGQPLVLVVTLPFDLAPGQRAELIVRDPNDSPIAQFELGAERFVMGSVLLQLQPKPAGGQWRPGTYEVSLRIGDQLELGEFVLRPSSVRTNPAQK